MPDEEYIRWLHEIHQEEDREVSNVSLADYFSDLPVAEPMAIQPDFEEMADHGLQEEDTVVEALADQGTQENTLVTHGMVDEDRGTQEEALADHNMRDEDQSAQEEASADHDTQVEETTQVQQSTPSHEAQQKTSNNPESSDCESRHISKYLIPTRPAKKDKTVCISGARVLIN